MKLQLSLCLALAISFVGLSPAVSKAQSKLKASFEMPFLDWVSVDAEATVEECSIFLQNQNLRNVKEVESAYKARGLAYARLDKCDLARSDFEKLCELRPKSAEARILLACLLLTLEKYDKAATRIEESLELDQRYALGHATKSQMLIKVGKFDQALEAATKAIELDPKCAGAYHLRGTAYFILRDVEHCLEDIDRLLVLEPMCSQWPSHPYWMRGFCLLALNRPSSALANFLLAHELRPEWESSLGICEVYLRMGKLHLADIWSKKTIKLQKDCLIAQIASAEIDLMLGLKAQSLETTIKLYKSANRTIGSLLYSREEILARMGMLCMGHGAYPQALILFEGCITADPKSGFGQLGKASLLATCPDAKYRNGSESLKLALDASRLMPKSMNWLVQIHLAEANAECGNYAEAVRCSKSVLDQVGQDFGRREELQQRLANFEKGMPYRIDPLK